MRPMTPEQVAVIERMRSLLDSLDSVDNDPAKITEIAHAFNAADAERDRLRITNYEVLHWAPERVQECPEYPSPEATAALDRVFGPDDQGAGS